ncbi:MAG: TIGR00180 family glycosyltransferase [Geobacter sp.]|nr:TIGR00180 family glycosyltransferase [Geobacter sp.]
MKTKDLTIFLPLKGRHLHTLRWLWHANRIRLPYHVIVADGEVHPTIARLLTDQKTFPNLSFEYHRYEDRTFSDYYYKWVDALGKVQTPYVMLSDNDDFLFPFGIQKSIAFLNSAPEYVCSGGGIPGFSIHERSHVAPNIIGPLHRIRYRYILNDWYRCRDVDDPSVASRILEEIKNPLAVYYNIYRTQALCTIADEILACNLHFRHHEVYFAMRAMTLGKVKSDPSRFICFRQMGTSLNFGNSTDMADDLLRPSFAQDFETMVSKIACEAAKSDGCDQAEIKDRIYEAFAVNLRMTLACTMMRYRFPRIYSLKQFLLALPRPRLMPEAFQRKLDIKRVWNSLASDGADRITISSHAAELEDILATLQGDEFVKFISQNASDLLAAS